MIRSLHFDSIEKQSSMDLQKPESLVLSYTVSMMTGFLLTPDASSFLCIGLGGASIPRFLFHHIPECLIDMVEIRRKVIDIARDYFYLPSDKHHRVFHEAGSDFISKPRELEYDMIFVDVYDKHGMVESVIDPVFFSCCKERLNANGVFCINLWSEPRKVYKDAIRMLQSAFGRKLLRIPVSERTNQIILGLEDRCKVSPLHLLKQRSRILEGKLNMPFTGLVRSLIKHNSSQFKIESAD